MGSCWTRNHDAPTDVRAFRHHRQRGRQKLDEWMKAHDCDKAPRSEGHHRKTYLEHTTQTKHFEMLFLHEYLPSIWYQQQNPEEGELNFILPTSSQRTTQLSFASSVSCDLQVLPEGRRNPAAVVKLRLGAFRGQWQAHLPLGQGVQFMENHQGSLIVSNHVSVGCIQDQMQVEAIFILICTCGNCTLASIAFFSSTSKGPPVTTLNGSHTHWYINSPTSHKNC